MQFLLDNILATLVGAAVLMILLVTQLRAREALADGSLSYAAKKQMITAGEVLDSDFQNVGAGVVNAGATVIDEFTDSTFTFYRRMEANGTLLRVRYARAAEGVASAETINGDTTVTTYFVNRSEISDTGTKQTGGLGHNITGWKVQLYDSSGVQILPSDTKTRWQDAQRIRLQLSVHVPTAGSGLYREMHWTSEFQPPSLRLAKAF